MESARLLIRPMEIKDEYAFVRGIGGRNLRAAYDFPVEADEAVSVRIFRCFIGMERSFSLVGKS